MQTPEGQKLKQFFVIEAAKLNRLDDIKLESPEDIAVETKARQRAYETVKKMLSTLLDDTQFDTMKEKDDSISTEMLQQERSQSSDQSNGEN